MSENSILELFSTDPLQLTRENFEEIIAHYRKNRLNFNVAQKKSPDTATAKKLMKAKELADKVDISLDDIEI